MDEPLNEIGLFQVHCKIITWQIIAILSDPIEVVLSNFQEHS